MMMDYEKEIQALKIRLRDTEYTVLRQGTNIFMLTIGLGATILLLMAAVFSLRGH
jgi:hypothetical protein